MKLRVESDFRSEEFRVQHGVFVARSAVEPGKVAKRERSEVVHPGSGHWGLKRVRKNGRGGSDGHGWCGYRRLATLLWRSRIGRHFLACCIRGVLLTQFGLELFDALLHSGKLLRHSGSRRPIARQSHVGGKALFCCQLDGCWRRNADAVLTRTKRVPARFETGKFKSAVSSTKGDAIGVLIQVASHNGCRRDR